MTGIVKFFSLAHLRLAYQIALIGAMALIGFVTIGAIYYFSSVEQDAVREVQLTETGGVRAVEAAKYGFLDARRREKDFLALHDMKYADAHTKVVAEVLPYFEELKSVHSEPSEQAMIDEIREGFLAYAKQFNEVVGMWQTIGLTPTEGLRGAMRDAVLAVETELTAAGDQQLLVTMLMMRRYEKDFLLRRDPKYIQKNDEEMAKFDMQLAHSSVIAAAEKADIAAKLDNYMEKFDEIAALYLEETEDSQTMSNLFAEVEPKLEALGKKGANDAAHATVELRANGDRTFLFMATVIGVVTLIVAGFSALIGRGISNPIGAMTGAMQKLAGGDLETHIPAQKYTNEIGQMAGAVQVFKENALKVKAMEAEQEEAARRAEEEKRAMMNKMADDFESSVGRVVEQVSSASTEMEASSTSMSATAEQTTRQSAAVAAASEEASANVQTVASAAEELSSSIGEISRQVAQASSIASGAVKQAKQTNTKIQGLAEAASKIGEVVALITDIADQTNLLALNATIEAARAGDAGKGFAVVASEVKNLANQTAKATDEIGTQITGIQTATQEAVAAISEITKTISEIDEVASGIASAVEQQGAATQEIARNVEQAAAGTQEVSSNITGVSQAATDTGAAAGQIRSAAGELSQQSETLRAEVGKFMANVRAA